MDQNRNRQGGPDHSSRMEQAEGSRETVRGGDSSRDLGTSSDRAMFDERSMERGRGSSDERGSAGSGTSQPGSGSMGSGQLGSDQSQSSDLGSEQSSSGGLGSESGERGRGSSGERNRSNTGGITNRELDREQSEQEQLPDRGRSQSEG